MKYFIYCRKSSDREDRQILSTDAQKRLLQDYADANNLTIVDTYVENQTAYKTGRPMFNEMLERLEKGEAEGIIAYHLTRIARNSFDGGRTIYMIDDSIVQEIRTPEKVYINTSDDKFMMQIHFAMAKKSSDDTSQFVTRDIESKLLKGEYPGMVPIGYLNINRDAHISKSQDDKEKYMMLLELNRPLKREEIDPIDGVIVKKFFEEVAERGKKGSLKVSHLPQLSFDMGLRSRKGKKLSRHAIENLLTNHYFYGVIKYHGRIYDDAYIQEKSGDPKRKIQHEALITKELFDDVQYALGTRTKGRYRRHNYSFGDCILRCGECSSPITPERQKGHVYYHCTGNRGDCSQKAWTREEVLSEQFSDILLGLRLPQSYLDFALSKLRKVHSKESKFADAVRKKHQGHLNAAQQKLDALLQMKISPNNVDGLLLSDEEYLHQKELIKEELHVAKKQLDTTQKQSENWVDDCERFFVFTQRVAAKFSITSVEDKKALLTLICQNLTLTNNKVAAQYQEPYRSLSEFPLAGKEQEFLSEPEKSLTLAKNTKMEESWLGRRDSNPRSRDQNPLPYRLATPHYVALGYSKSLPFALLFSVKKSSLRGQC